jgi:hypothetical protein
VPPVPPTGGIPQAPDPGPLPPHLLLPAHRQGPGAPARPSPRLSAPPREPPTARRSKRLS